MKKLVKLLGLVFSVLYCFLNEGCNSNSSRFTAEEITFTNEKDGTTLSGTLTKPTVLNKYPLAILISGSGQQDREETVYGHKPFKVLAEFLSANGIGVLRYDDRGVGGSTGDVWGATIEIQASDAYAGIQYLKSCCYIDPYSIGIIGHSLGAMQGALLASKYSDISFLVMLGGIGMSWKENQIKADGISNRLKGEHTEVIEAGTELLESIWTVMENTPYSQDYQTTKGLLREVLYNWEVQLTGQVKNEIEKFTEKNPNWMKSMAEEYATPIYISCAKFNPSQCLINIDCPVLSIIGEKDTQVVPENNDAIGMALEKGGNENYEIITATDINHILQKCETGLISEYEKIDEEFNEGVMSEILQWILGLP